MNATMKSPALAGNQGGHEGQGHEAKSPAERFAETMGSLRYSITKMRDMSMPVKSLENTVRQLGALRKSLSECYMLAFVALGEARGREDQ